MQFMCTESSGKTGICTKIVNLVKHQYVLSGDAIWNSVEHPFIAQELYENLQTLHGPQTNC